MKILRFAIATVAISSIAAFATNARVESMGKRSTFIMDDISIFDNPANINLYPNFLIGELGSYVGSPEVDNVEAGKNHDPINPWFGGIFSLDIGSSNSLSIAGVLNRKEERLFKYFPDRIGGQYYFDSKVAKKTPDPVTNFDGFLGANFSNKAFGVHVYFAHQDGIDGNGNIDGDAFVSALQLDLGTNIEISSDVSFELSGGVARLQYGPADRDFLDTDLLSIFANGRIFSKIQAINGHLIPAASFRNMNAPGRDETDIMGGMGVDAAFERGFFWLGLEGFYNKQRAGSNWRKNCDGNGDCENINVYKSVVGEDDWGMGEKTSMWQIGGTISFGIERNIWWDWFVIRVGGQKTIAYVDYRSGKDEDGVHYSSILCPAEDSNCENIKGNFFMTNPINDGTRNDNVGFGFGINIEEKLKIDATVAEDVVFRNPFQGTGRLISKVSATYSF